MIPKIINQSTDLSRLWNEGYVMEVKNGYLFVYQIPYVNSQRQIRRGTLVTNLRLNGDTTVRPDNHVIHFIGEFPCHKDGTPINQIRHHTGDHNLGSFVVNHSFSNKPLNGFDDYYQKITSYIRVISHPAKSIDHSITEKTFEIIDNGDADSVFQYVDTNSTRADINTISMKLAAHKIAIVGLGGTGSYVLDFIAKTPVQEIHLIDGDDFLQHNAFRAPGATPKAKFYEHLKKTDYWKEIYSNIHKGIFSHPVCIEASNIELLKGKTFVFLCMDTGPAKKLIIDFLEENAISFIDVGMGLEVVEDSLIGSVRVTTSTNGMRDHIRKYISFVQDDNNEYDQNIQIAELNALNATMAVIKWKKLCGFYRDHDKEQNSTYSVYTNEITNGNNAV